MKIFSFKLAKQIPSPVSALLLVLLILSGCERANVENNDLAAGVEKGPHSKVETATQIETNGSRRSSATESKTETGPPSGSAVESSALPEKQQREVLDAVATILGSSSGVVDLDRPIIDPARGIEEFDLMEILLEIEDRFEVEIDEEVIRAATGSRFAEVQTKLTPRLFFDIVAEATRNRE